ncbi:MULTISPECIES: hypothetical protein [unclassified Saccharothrix]|uniref:hypothetical protein n=1 Tax=unclassified Saccharothrix TaxID=2593673 RepID=UPI00307EFF55
MAAVTLCASIGPFSAQHTPRWAPMSGLAVALLLVAGFVLVAVVLRAVERR